jgi:hypothetical protein
MRVALVASRRAARACQAAARRCLFLFGHPAAGRSGLAEVGRRYQLCNVGVKGLNGGQRSDTWRNRYLIKTLAIPCFALTLQVATNLA